MLTFSKFFYVCDALPRTTLLARKPKFTFCCCEAPLSVHRMHAVARNLFSKFAKQRERERKNGSSSGGWCDHTLCIPLPNTYSINFADLDSILFFSSVFVCATAALRSISINSKKRLTRGHCFRCQWNVCVLPNEARFRHDERRR